MSEVEPLWHQGTCARVAVPHGDAVGAVLTRRRMAFLAVQLQFQGHSVVGTKLQFFEGDNPESKGAAIGDKLRTDEFGVARLPWLMPVGHYLCELEHQEQLASITTVFSLSDSFALPLPIGRHIVDTDHGLDLARATAVKG